MRTRRWFGLPNDEFLVPWRSISAEQPGGLDTKATGLESNADKFSEKGSSDHETDDRYARLR